MPGDHSFIYLTCQRGAERAVKNEISRYWPQFRFAYSRPGFLTFRLPLGFAPAADFDLHSVFARAYGFTLGRVIVDDASSASQDVWHLAENTQPHRLHVWQSDLAPPGFRGYEPGITAESLALRELLLASRPIGSPSCEHLENDSAAASDDQVLDCILVNECEWWVGWHVAASVPSQYPGGFIPIPPLPDGNPISRAFFKIEEAIRWRKLPLCPGQHVVEIGSSPGGAAQALLHRGLFVTAIDPAEMHPALMTHPRFTHIRKRGHEVRRREFARAEWLAADMNVAPKYALDTIESIVTHPGISAPGVILTLKLLDWCLADQLPEFLDRVRSWGYDDVRARQLQHDRQEVCVVATRLREIQ